MRFGKDGRRENEHENRAARPVIDANLAGSSHKKHEARLKSLCHRDEQDLAAIADEMTKNMENGLRTLS